MFMLPATSVCPSNGSPSCSAITLRPPSAPIRYFARISYVAPPTRSSTGAVTPSSSCTRQRNSVSNRTCVPRSAACAQQDRLEQRLREVACCDGARQLVVGLASGCVPQRTEPAELLAGETRAEDGVAHQVVRRALGDDGLLEAHVAHDLDRALVRDVRPRRVRRPAVLREHHVLHAVRGQEQGGASRRRARCRRRGRRSRRCSRRVACRVPSARSYEACRTACRQRGRRAPCRIRPLERRDQRALDAEDGVAVEILVAGDEDVGGNVS